MIIESLLEQSIIGALQSELGDDVQLVGSRLETKIEDADKKTIVAVASGFRNHDAFSLSLINVPVAISVATRVEGDAQSQEHNSTVEKIVDVLVNWHKDGESMSDALTNRKFLAGELRMDGGTTQTFDRERMIWTDAININIRGAEKFIKPTVVMNLDGTKRVFEISGTIENGWISDPYNVKEVSIGDEVTVIGERSFTGFGQMSSIVVPKNVKSIMGEAFSYTGLTEVVIEDGVTELGYGVFAYSNGLSSIRLPSTLTKIGADVFEECGSLASVSIPKSVVNISRVAFRYSRLTELTMVGRTKEEARAMENYGWGLQNGCVIHCSDGDIVIGATTVTYVNGDVSDVLIQGSLSSQSIPDKENAVSVAVGSPVDTIDEMSFKDCSSLRSITFPSTLNKIRTQAFYNCSSLANVELPDRMTTISTYGFYGCTSLTSVNIPTGLTYLDDHVFQGCTSLTEISIPDNITRTGWYAFAECSSLANVHMGSGITTLGTGTFKDCTSLTSIVLGENIETIESQTFMGCTNLAQVVVGDKVRTIGGNTFYNCSALQSLTLPSSVQSIGGYTFYGCSSLRELTMNGKTVAQVKAMANYASWRLPKGCIIHCSDGNITI